MPDTLPATDHVAVIYTRVSSAAQTKRGDGLGSQETRCREFAKAKGYDVLQVFSDDVTGATKRRPGIVAMLKFIRSIKKLNPVVIIDDVSRLARGVQAHIELRTDIAKAGGKLESPTIEFGEDSDSILVENLLASVSQHQRQKNAEQTKNRMRSRMLNGYWCFQAPVGYAYQSVRGQGKVLVPDQPAAAIIKEALEGFATGRFSTQADVTCFLSASAAFPKHGSNKTIPQQRIKDLLTRPIYAGMVEAPEWGVTRRKGHHEPIISVETFNAIQDKLNANYRPTPRRKDMSEDFPLRGSVFCASCGTKLTAYWAKGRHTKYAYYECRNRDCEHGRKSIPKQRIETEFDALLTDITPSADLVDMVRALVNDVTDQQLQLQKDERQLLRKQRQQIENQIDGLVDRIVTSESDTVVRAMENRISALESQKLEVIEQLEAPKIQTPDRNGFEHALKFLQNPQNYWHSGDPKKRGFVTELTFSSPLFYERGEGFRTPELSLPFKALKEINDPEKAMAHLGGESSRMLIGAFSSWIEKNAL